MSRPTQTHRDAAIAEAYRSGLSMEKVAAKVGCHPSWVAKRLAVLGIESRPRTQAGPRQIERNARIGEAYAGGLTLQQVAEQHGLSCQRVGEIVAALGIPRRPSASAKSQAAAGQPKAPKQPKAPPKPAGEAIIPAGVKVTICPAGKDHRFTATRAEPFFARGVRLPASPWVQAITGSRS